MTAVCEPNGTVIENSCLSEAAGGFPSGVSLHSLNNCQHLETLGERERRSVGRQVWDGKRDNACREVASQGDADSSRVRVADRARGCIRKPCVCCAQWQHMLVAAISKTLCILGECRHFLSFTCLSIHSIPNVINICRDVCQSFSAPCTGL